MNDEVLRHGATCAKTSAACTTWRAGASTASNRLGTPSKFSKLPLRSNVVEIGTSNGYSGLWFSLALRKTGGHLTTFDIDEGRFQLAKANFAKAGVSELITQVLGDAAYTAGLERITARVDGVPQTYVLRATQIYRREDGAWKVAHRHGSAPPR